MKKILIAVLFLMISQLPASAANGDIAGNIYSTDIRAYINGVEVESYNIGGKTAVVVEDILDETTHQYIYSDYYRTLKIWSFNPRCLVEGKSENTIKSGKVIGNIYETDIKTSIYDVVLPSYNIGGKTAVTIEDLGLDNEFSPIGGKYIWDENERTIKLEFMYQNSSLIPEDKSINIVINDGMTEAEATFNEVFHCGGGNEALTIPLSMIDNPDIEAIIPIRSSQGETIGYYFRRPSQDYDFTAFSYYYPEKLNEAAKVYTPAAIHTREDIITHFSNNHAAGVVERFDTENYSFAYMSIAYTSGSSNYLVQAFDDGRYIDYMDQVRIINRGVRDLLIDKENEVVTFKYEDRYTPEWFTNYKIDLKSCTINEI